MVVESEMQSMEKGQRNQKTTVRILMTIGHEARWLGVRILAVLLSGPVAWVSSLASLSFSFSSIE